MLHPIGALRARVRLERPTRAADELGGGAIAWTDEGAVWAEIAAQSASSHAALDATAAIASYTLTIRPHGAVRPGWRAVWGVRRFRIVGVRNAGATRIALVCEEEIL